MPSDASDTRWLHLLKAGDRSAAQILWEQYFRLLVGCPRQRLGAVPRRAADQEDVALSAFASFCRGVEKGRFPRLEDRGDLRSVLLLLVARKAAHQVRDQRCRKRGGGLVRVEADREGDRSDEGVLAQLIDAGPTRTGRATGREVRPSDRQVGRGRPACHRSVAGGRLHRRGDRSEAGPLAAHGGP